MPFYTELSGLSLSFYVQQSESWNIKVSIRPLSWSEMTHFFIAMLSKLEKGKKSIIRLITNSKNKEKKIEEGKIMLTT